MIRSPNSDNLLDILIRVLLRADDQNPIQQVQGDTMWRLVFGTPDLRHPSVRGHHHQGCKLRFQSTVQERETLDIEHVNLVDE